MAKDRVIFVVAATSVGATVGGASFVSGSVLEEDIVLFFVSELTLAGHSYFDHNLFHLLGQPQTSVII